MVSINTTVIAQSSELPELGDSATKYLTPVQENQIGQDFLRQLINNKYFIEDYELQDYLQNMGDRVGATADLREIKLNFNLLKNNALNAFAVPGGYITFNTGLLTATDTESELASVVGHEIAHLTQRHLPRLIARANDNKLPAIAAIIGSILIGGQAGLAGITATSAAVASNELSYTRGFEREADAIGIQLLASAEYDPKAMAQFFSKLERFTRHDSTIIPEFLSTHPLSYTRVAESESRASEFLTVNHQNSFEYYLAKAKIQTLYVERSEHPILYFKDGLNSSDILLKDAATYGTAITLLDSRNYDKAREVLAPMLDRFPTHPWIQSAQAEIDFADGDAESAIQRYTALIDNNPQKTYINYHLANTYLLNSQPELAKKLLRYQIRRNPDLYRLYRLLSKANADLENLAEAHQADAEYHAILGNYKGAIESLKLALRESGSEGYLAQSITARLTSLEEQLALQNRIRKG